MVAVLAAFLPTLNGCSRAPVAGGAASVATPVPVAAAARATVVPAAARAAAVPAAARAVATPVCAGGACTVPVAPRIPVPDVPGKDDAPSTAILGAGNYTRNGRGK